MPELILLTGATGCVGGRLLSVMQERGVRVRCLTRRLEVLSDRSDATTEIVAGDVFDLESLVKTLTDVDTAFYFVHSMERPRHRELHLDQRAKGDNAA